MNDIEIRLLSLDDIDSLEKYFKEDFALREPATSHLKIPPDSFWEFFKPLVEVCVKLDITFGAFDKRNGAMCGISVNILGNADAPEPDLSFPYHLSVKQLFKLLKQTYPNGMPNHVGTSNYLEIFFLGVMDGYGKRGIGTELCKRSMERAKQLGCEQVTVDCTSAYSRKAVENLGFSVIHELVYEDYVDSLTGKMVMQGIQNPHYASTLLAIKL